MLLAALACGAVAAAISCLMLALPLRARVEQLELERPRFLAEMHGLLEACDESLDRADAKRKRADNTLRRKQQLEEQEAAAPPEGTTLVPFRRGTIMEKLG